MWLASLQTGKQLFPGQSFRANLGQVEEVQPSLDIQKIADDYRRLVEVEQKVFDTRQRYCDWRAVKNWDYPVLRQYIHGHIAKHLLQNQPPQLDQPSIIFTAGAMGAGKTFFLDVLKSSGILDPNDFVWNDPDEIKPMLPEYEPFFKIDAKAAATAVHLESGHIQEILFEHAMRNNHNAVVDSSLRDKNYWFNEFSRIRRLYPQNRIVILFVESTLEKLKERVRQRELVTGRHVPEEKVEESYYQVKEAIKLLMPLSDMVVHVENVDQLKISGVTVQGEKNHLAIPL